MLKLSLAAAAALAAIFFTTGANAQSTVECRSHNYQYDECYAGPLTRPQLIHQISGASCILNRTWGFNPQSRYIWVAQGCSGVFADVGGYHHGRGDKFDKNARHYDKHGHDVGSVAAGVVIGAIIEGLADSGKHHHTTSNYRHDGKYSGCHGEGCLVDNPDIATGDFDADGRYQGCHGVGCLTDDE